MFEWKKYLWMTVACILTGILLTWAVKAQTAAEIADKSNKNTTLIDIIDNLETETETLEETIGSIRKQIDEIQNNGSDHQVSGLQKKVQQLKLSAGQTDVQGPGISIVLEDNNAGAEAAKINDPELYDPEDFIVHDKNLLYLTSSLRHEAKAIAINNQRLVATSDIRCVGTVIMVNSTRLAPPFEISVIGDPKILEAAVLNSDEYIYLQSKEMPVSITKETNLSIPAYKGSNVLKFAQPVKEGE